AAGALGPGFGKAPVSGSGEGPAAPEPPRLDSNSVAHLKQTIATDPRTHELEIQIEASGTKVLLRGDVTSEERRNAVEEIVKECFAENPVENQIRVIELSEPTQSEEIR